MESQSINQPIGESHQRVFCNDRILFLSCMKFTCEGSFPSYADRAQYFEEEAFVFTYLSFGHDKYSGEGIQEVCSDTCKECYCNCSPAIRGERILL